MSMAMQGTTQNGQDYAWGGSHIRAYKVWEPSGDKLSGHVNEGREGEWWAYPVNRHHASFGPFKTFDAAALACHVNANYGHTGR